MSSRCRTRDKDRAQAIERGHHLGPAVAARGARAPLGECVAREAECRDGTALEAREHPAARSEQEREQRHGHQGERRRPARAPEGDGREDRSGRPQDLGGPPPGRVPGEQHVREGERCGIQGQREADTRVLQPREHGKESNPESDRHSERAKGVEAAVEPRVRRIVRRSCPALAPRALAPPQRDRALTGDAPRKRWCPAHAAPCESSAARLEHPHRGRPNRVGRRQTHLPLRGLA
jgi:hypothetical protein